MASTAAGVSPLTRSLSLRLHRCVVNDTLMFHDIVLIGTLLSEPISFSMMRRPQGADTLLLCVFLYTIHRQRAHRNHPTILRLRN